jgi:hypothetical protein
MFETGAAPRLAARWTGQESRWWSRVRVYRERWSNSSTSRLGDSPCLQVICRHGWGGRDRSELVAALLWESDPEEACREAKEGGCRRDLWLALARARERDHPGDALEVYVAQIEPAIRSSDNHTYAGAVEWLEKAQALFARLKQEDAFDQLVRDILERHRAKRNLIKRLEERGWARLPGKRAVHS